MKRLNVITFFILVVLFLCPVKMAYGQTADEAYAKAKNCYQDLKSDALKTVSADNWQKCIGLFKDAANNFSGDPKAANALYTAGRINCELYEKTKKTAQLEEAVHLYNAVVKDYPQNVLADDALYQIGVLRQGRFKDNEKARRAFEAILSRYPQGDMSPKAKTALLSLDAKDSVAEKTEEKKSGKPLLKPPPINEKFRFGKLKKIQVAVLNDQTTAAIELSDRTPYTKKIEEAGPRTKSPARLTLKFPRTKIDKAVSSQGNIASPYLSAVHVKHGIFSGEAIVRFDLNGNSDYEIIPKGNLIVVRFFPHGKKIAAPPESKKTLRIVIDPGHGGEDKDAVGPTGIREKDVALSLAKKTAEALKKKLGASVFLTRAEDKKISLEDRNKFANEKNADLFISIHANAHKSRDISGIETFYLNNATDEAAERLAQRENQSASKPQDEVERILLTMFQNYNAEESRTLAENVQSSIVARLSKRYSQVNDRHVRSALFYVLVGAKCPGILVESSYISNKIEEKRLANPTYQAHIAEAIAEGVERYLKTNSARQATL